MSTFGPPPPSPVDFAGKWMLDQKDREQRMKRMALVGALMGSETASNAGPLGSVASGISRGLGQGLLLREMRDGGKGWGLPGTNSGNLWTNGFGEASFGPDKIGIRDGIRGLFGLPK